MASHEQEMSIKTKLSKLHCPFTWEVLDSVMKSAANIDKLDEDQEISNKVSCPLEMLIEFLLYCYKAVLSADKDAAVKRIEEAEEILMQIQQEKEVYQTIRAIEHVFYATKCFFLYDVEKMNELEEIIKNIDTDHFSDEEIGALYGCQSVVWSCLKDFGMNKAIDMAKKAVERNQDCALWHFILAKNLRRQRRSINLCSEISNLEKQHFEIAYAISKNHVFGIYYLQMRLENFYVFNRERDYMMRKKANEKQVLQIAKNIVKTKPTNYTVLLKLALIFLRVRDSDERLLLAKECLDAVDKLVPNHCTCLHYTAMLYVQCGEFKEAIKYYKKAAELNNFAAEFSYIQYGWETGELEPLPHLLQMLKKYKQSIKIRQIAMLLAIAVTYYSLHRDIPNAAKYFIDALTIDPMNQKFKTYYKFLDFKIKNISSFLSMQFCPLLENRNYQEMSRKIKSLLNVNDVTDLVGEFGALSMDTIKKHPDSSTD